MKEALIVVAGPTATGKSALAVETALRTGGEVISADSMQVYRHMDIGSAKITREEMRGVPHHLIDVLEPWEEMDVSRYAELARRAIDRIRERGHLPILCGGTGFYIQAVIRDVNFTETEADPEFRREMAAYAASHGNEALHRLLMERDPASAAVIHPNNVRRVIRALEFYRETGVPISVHNAEEKKRESPYDLLYIFLDDDREELYRRIDRRVDHMMEQGLTEEVASLMAMGVGPDCASMKGIGYKEIAGALMGGYSMEEAVRLVKRESRHYAKRQQTWFKREKDAVRLARGEFDGDPDRILHRVCMLAEERLGIECVK